MRHHDQAAVELLEVVLEPLHRRQVEVVGGLVEEQQRGVGEQQGGECRAHAPAAAELGERAVLVGAPEPQAVEHPARLGLERMLVVELEVVLDLAGALEQRAERRVVGGDALEPLVERVELDPHLGDRAVGLHGALEHGAVVALGGLLGQVAEPAPARQHPRARLGPELAQHDPDERGLAGPVGPHQGAAIAGREHPVEPVEQDALADAVLEVVELDHAAVDTLSTPPDNRV